ncbi:hypothetical protein AA313_de0208758 [Arthrobotrys entomopaga]|nr:hypothetical protein AA313_de0208758 [Arthrobotrys entomopaga]
MAPFTASACFDMLLTSNLVSDISCIVSPSPSSLLREIIPIHTQQVEYSLPSSSSNPPSIFPRQHGGYRGSAFEDRFWKVALSIMLVWVFAAMSCGTLMIHRHNSRLEKEEKLQLLELREKNRLKAMGIQPPEKPPEDPAAIAKRQKKYWKRIKIWTTKPKVDEKDERSEVDGLPRNFPIPRTPIPWDNFREPPMEMGREAEELDTVQPMMQKRRQTISSFARRPTISSKTLLGADPKTVHKEYRNLPSEYFELLNRLGLAEANFTPWEKEDEEPHTSVLTRMLRVSEAMAEGRDFRYGEETAESRNTPRAVRVSVKSFSSQSLVTLVGLNFD